MNFHFEKIFTPQGRFRVEFAAWVRTQTGRVTAPKGQIFEITIRNICDECECWTGTRCDWNTPCASHLCDIVADK